MLKQRGDVGSRRQGGHTLVVRQSSLQGQVANRDLRPLVLCPSPCSVPQVVWASTHQVGCGATFCEKIDGIETENMYLLVCNYYPP